MKALGDVLHRLSAWLLLAAMATAPWALGTMPPAAIIAILGVLGAAGACWGAGLLLRGGERMPPVNAATLLAGLLLVQGFWMTAHPVSSYNSATRAFEKIDGADFLPGSVDGHSSRLGMLSLGVLFLAFHVALDHARGGENGDTGEEFRRTLAWVVAATGASVAALGALQRMGATDFLLGYMHPQEGQPFGPFNYHANAGAFLLMTLPMAAALAARALASAKTAAGMVASALGAVILGGIFANSARGAAAMAVVLTVVLGLAIWRMLSPVMPGGGRKTWWLAAVGVTAALIAGAALTLALMPAKWALLRQQIAWHSPRMILWQIDAGMAVDAGVLGYGPNTFAVEFPGSPRMNPDLYSLFIVTYHTPGARVSIWSHAHNDALQAVIEWGWLGGALWLALAVMTVLAGWRACRRDSGGPANSRLVLLGAYFAILAVLTYSLFDFPLQVLVLQLYAVCLAAVLWAEGGWKIARTLRSQGGGEEHVPARG